MKTEILAAIGESELQPAARLNAALRPMSGLYIKYYFSLLQIALAHAEHPEQPAATLKRERIACVVDDPDLDARSRPRAWRSTTRRGSAARATSRPISA